MSETTTLRIAFPLHAYTYFTVDAPPLEELTQEQAENLEERIWEKARTESPYVVNGFCEPDPNGRPQVYREDEINDDWDVHTDGSQELNLYEIARQNLIQELDRKAKEWGEKIIDAVEEGDEKRAWQIYTKCKEEEGLDVVNRATKYVHEQTSSED